MRDLAFVGYLLALLALGFRRPFLFVLAYAYVDIVSPQHLSYFLLNAVPLSMIKTFEETYGVRACHGWGMTEMSPVGSLVMESGKLIKVDPERYMVNVHSLRATGRITDESAGLLDSLIDA